MKVVLLKDVHKLGKTGDVKEVAAGYARNFLIPKGLAQAANEKVLKVLELRKAIQEKKAEVSLTQTEALAQALEGFELEIAMKTADDGTLFASVSKDVLAKALHEKGHNVRAEQVQLEHPLKETGEYPVVLQLDHGLEATIRVRVVPEMEAPSTEKKKSGRK